METISQPWPWYIGGIIIGLMVPALLVVGNRHFGISANLRHICAACFPARIRFFQYDWKKESWNLVFVAGIMLGAFIAVSLLKDPSPVKVNSVLANELSSYGISDNSRLLPGELFSFKSLLTARGIILLIGGGLLVGFGTRYAGGCTSGHAIMGLSSLQWPSLVATICFMAGGFLMANLVLPFILRL